MDTGYGNALIVKLALLVPILLLPAVLGLRSDPVLRAATFAEFVDYHPAFEDTLRFAAAAGALATTRNGAFAAMPDTADIDRLLQAAA